MEDDGVVDEPVRFHVTVTIDGDRMIVDWTGSAPQVRGPINATYGVTAGAVYNAVFHVTDSAIPKNSGAYRPIYIIAPPGTVANVVYPGPSVGGNTETHPKLVDMVTGALAPVMREKVAAAEGASACNFLFGGVHPKTGEFYANYHLEGCGWGAKDYDDGNDCTIVVNGNCRNTPVEIFETRYPLETVEYSLSRTRAAPAATAAGWGRAASCASARAPRSPRARSSTARRASSGPGASRAAARRLRRDPGQARRRDRVPHVPGGLRHGVGVEVHEHRPAEGDEVMLDAPGGGGFGDRWSATGPRSPATSTEGIVSHRGGAGALRLGAG